MSIEELINIIEIGHEIEFRLCENKYFLQPCYIYNRNRSGEPWFVIYACNDSNGTIELVRGTCQNIIKYKFPNDICLERDIDAFVFDAIL